MSHFNFNVRVYGLLINQGKLLVSDEYIKGQFYTKLPGGGLETGEGTRDCLIREFKEETGLEITVGQHLYTTDFYQPSAFDPEDQVISIYYWVHCADLSCLKTHLNPGDFEMALNKETKGRGQQDAEGFRWMNWQDLSEDSMSLPIDKEVVSIILAGRPKELAGKQADGSGQPAAYYIQRSPFIVPTTDHKLIEEHFGGASTGRKDISIAHMVAPPGWSEPAQWPDFEEWTLVNTGKKCLEINGEEVILEAGQSIWVAKGARVRYSNPFEGPCDYWSVCLPAFSPDRVHREPA